MRDVAAFVAHHPRLLRSLTLNATIHDSAVLQAQLLSTREIISRIRAMIGSRRHNAFVTPLETLTDILVHSQDIAIPLGLDLAMRPTPSALAATRRWDTRRHLARHCLPTDSPSTVTGSPPPTPTGPAGKDPRSQDPSAHSSS